VVDCIWSCSTVKLKCAYKTSLQVYIRPDHNQHIYAKVGQSQDQLVDPSLRIRMEVKWKVTNVGLRSNSVGIRGVAKPRPGQVLAQSIWV